MDSYPEKDGYNDVVFTVYWRCNANNCSYNSTSYGSVDLIFDSSFTFIPYKSLTHGQVVDWVKSSLGIEQVSQIELNLENQIQKLINPIVVTLFNPWDLT